VREVSGRIFFSTFMIFWGVLVVLFGELQLFHHPLDNKKILAHGNFGSVRFGDER
jgi:hypothetical protein